MTTDSSYGEKYAATKNLSQVEVAKLIRADIKAGVKAGTLPKAKYSVTCQDSAIRIQVSSVEGIPTYNAERLLRDHAEPHVFCGLNMYSHEMVGVLRELDRIHGAYNFDGSDLMTDYHHVRFFGHATVASDPAVRAAELAAALGVVSPGVPANETAPAQNDYLAYLGAV
jgi:hypothetical protein